MRVNQNLSLVTRERLDTVANVAKKEQPPRVKGDELARVRAGHRDAKLRTQQSLATHAGMSTRTVARAEDGYASFETVEQLAMVLGVPVWDLWIPLDPAFAPPGGAASAAASTSGADGKLDEILSILKHIEGSR